MKGHDLPVQDGESGEWRVSTFIVTEHEADRFNLCSMFSAVSSGNYRGGLRPGNYKRLSRGNTVVMSNTPAEMEDLRIPIIKARGSVLINGLGLGVFLNEILCLERVVEVTVIEKSSDVIKLVSPFFTDDRVTIINDDAFTWKPPAGKRYNTVWHDIWDDIDAEKNLPEMTKLHRKYGKRCDWQGSWCKRECLRGMRR